MQQVARHRAQPAHGTTARSKCVRSPLPACLRATARRPLQLTVHCQQQDQQHPQLQQLQQQPEPRQQPLPPRAATPVPRRSVVDTDTLHRPLGLVAVGAYVLGTCGSFTGGFVVECARRGAR